MPVPPVERVRQLATTVRGEKSAAFYGWAAAYLAADAAERPRLTAEGRRLAEARRAEFRAVIVEDPRRALDEAVPMVVRQQLPEQIVQRLETRVNGVAAIRVMQGVPLPGEPRPVKSLTHRVAEFADGKTYRAYVYSERAAKLTWTAGASLNGVALETDFAVNEQPSRTLEVGEIPNVNKPAVTVCPVSGKTTALAAADAVSEHTPAVETATQIVSFCGSMHIDPYNQTLIMGEGVSGGAFGFTGILPSAPTPALGNVKVLAIPMTFADQATVPSTEAQLSATLRDVGDFYAKASFGRISLVGVVTPPVKLPHNEAWYVNRDTSNGGDIDGEGTEHVHARDEARKLGYDSNDYDCIVVRHNGGPGSYGGLGGGSSVWVRGDSVSLWAHEIGHCFGLGHSNFWDTAGTSAIGAGTNQEYGDSYDIMGGGPYAAGHYNAQAKTQIKWLPSNFTRAVSQSGLYRLYAFDQGVLLPNRDYAMTIVKDAQKTYWAEVRSLYDTNPWVKNGVLLGWRYPNGSGSNLQRIDVTPGSPFSKEDAPVSLGLTFSDRESGIHITTVGVNDSPRYADVVVNFGQFPGNHDPVLALAASAEVVPTGATVTFTATASDEDGDTLAYSWQNFGDTSVKVVAGNSPVITRTFPTAGTYVVSCTASDMKGGTTTRTKLITVGNGNGRFTISGRVTLLGVGLQDVVITANGANGVVTDAGGYYTIPNLTANTYTMTPLLYGYTFGELFNNSVTVGPSSGGADFEATPTPSVAIAASLPNANELAPVTAGRFTFTRTGDISQDLVVNVNTALGSATKGTSAPTGDYYFTPDYVAGSQGFSTFTIPAGSASFDVNVTPNTDTSVEGPETVILQVGPGNGYLVGTQSTATVVINDDDTALPKVSIAVTTLTTVENSGQPAVLTFTRTGAVTSPLTVNYTVSGTATSGADFTALSGSVVIPINAASAVVNIAPIDDAVSEPLETVKLTTTANAAYLIDPIATNATVSLIDDDVQTVSVVATDPSAKEVDLTQPGAVADTGTFVITRSGDTTNLLTVYYAVTGTPATGVTALHGVDYEALPGVLTIPAGATQAAVTIIPRYDAIGEGPETVLLTLGAGSTNFILGTASSATVTNADAATDVPYIDVVNISKAAEPGTSGSFRITCRGGTGTGTFAVSYALSGTATTGTDYTITGTSNTTTGTTITLNNGATVTKDVVVTPMNDATAEELESVTLTLTPGAAYSTFAPTASATMWMRDDDQPTVYVDTQVGTNAAMINTFTEGASTSPVKFYVSRTGSTTAALTVNYTIGGTATSGSDFTALSGSVTIAAGSLGADVPVVITNDTSFEGTETITFDFAAGAYAAGPGAVMYIADNETSAQTIGFASGSAAGLENVATVQVPVSLATPATAPVTVEYAADSGTRTSASATNNTQALPYWVRMVKTGTSFASYCSNDGQTWVQLGTTQTITFGSTSYLAGLCVTSGVDGTLGTAVFDNVSISGLTSGSPGAVTSADIGAVAATGSYSVNAGTYTVTGSGADIWNTLDEFRYVWFPITASANCTITARVISQTNTTAWAKSGVMIRESSAAGSRQAMTAATPGNGRAYQYRGTTSGSSIAVTNTTALLRPLWVRLERAGNLFTASQSPDGATWTTVGTPKTMALSTEVLAGLAVSARNDSTVTTATFDSVSLTGSPTLLGRTVGYVNTEGSDSVAGGTYTIAASGAQIGGSEDECHFVAAPVTGNFTLIARVLTQSGGNANAQAGVMVRESGGFRVRNLYLGSVANAGSEFITRESSITNAFGSGVDYTLGAGVLNFAIGEQTKNITLAITDDSMVEPDDNITIVLRNPNGATMGALSQFTYTIIDNDAPAALPFAGFAAATSSVGESAANTNLLVSLSTPATAAVTLDYTVSNSSTATADADFTLADGSVSFAVGESVKAIPVTILPDILVEPSETVVVTLSNVSGAQFGSVTTHTLTIADDDFPAVSIAATDPSAAESGDPGTFTITRAGSLAGDLVVNFTRSGTATSGTDYAAIATPGSVTILSGQSSGTVTVSPIQDATSEGNDTVILTLTATPASYTLGTPTTATVTIADDDRSTVTIVANDPAASETPGSPGQFTVTRTAPTTASLTVNLTVSGTATSGTDYTTSPTTVTTLSFTAGQSTRTIDILPVNDSPTEGPEDMTISISSGTYDIGAASFANVTIADNDSPPTIFIASPSAQGPLIATGNGVIVSATVTDDGAPQPTTLVWTQAAGPGTATIESPTNATTAVTFSAPGTYVLRVTATDGQFTVSDQATVVVGSSIVAADWITQDLGPSSSRRGQGLQTGSLFSISGTGVGYGTTSDQAHVMVRAVDGDTSIVARVTSLPTNGTLAGITMRDSIMRAATRAVLGYVPGTVPALQFRTRTTVNTNDTVVTQSSVTLPIWLKLERNATTNEITASYASDASGSPGAWTQLGTPTVVPMDARADVGLTATSNSTASTATAVIDNVTLTPAPVGPALLSEDSGNTPAAAGSASLVGSTYTISGSTSGYYHGWQFNGDMMLTVKHATATSGAGSATSGIRVSENLENGGYAHAGRIPTGSYNGYYWRSIAGGGTGGVPSFTGATRWIRIIRLGNAITAFHAADVSGNPGTWAQLGQPQTVIMTTPVFVGFWVDNASGVGLNTVTFTNLSIVPLNTAPNVNIAPPANYALSPLTLDGTVTDDNFPAPPTVTTAWSKRSGPGTATFTNAAAIDTSVALSAAGSYVLRLQADDGSVETFRDLSVTGYLTAFDVWRGQQWAGSGGLDNVNSLPGADPDGDGLKNIFEYTVGTSPLVANPMPVVSDFATVGPDRFLRLSVSRNPSATGMQLEIQGAGGLSNPAAWSSSGLIIEANTPTTLRVRDSVPVGSVPSRYLRVRVAE